ncbi:hypothetical protein [Pseudoalteromonas sp. S2893]|uniref:hypothetical protein n=1 Tax=Pseudoalteromonas sp. S2893 TaxID=579530 RepID=UPI00110AEB57|nr:hypothetical protein [Pseudoalteromonas sp. S2893]TMP18931.1 hypothetical protein CWC04_04835 [Pseudoalteromonas sp. S2893]
MEYVRKVWFWLTLIVCPILILWAFYTIGKLVGHAVVSQSSMPAINSTHLVPICGGICALSVLLNTLRKAKVRFARANN